MDGRGFAEEPGKSSSENSSFAKLAFCAKKLLADSLQGYRRQNKPLMRAAGLKQLTKVFSGTKAPWVGYVAGMGGLGAGCGLEMALEHWRAEGISPWPWFALSAMIAGWLGGIGPGLVTALVGWLLGDWLFVPPKGALFGYGAGDIVGLSSYALTTGIALMIIERLHRVRRRLEGEMRGGNPESAGEVRVRRAEELVAQQFKEEQALAREVLRIQETERRKLARDLHDQVGQSLSLAQLHLQSLQIEQGAQALDCRLQECCDILERTIEQVQRLSLDLRPTMLDDLGLVHALRWYTNQARSIGLNAVFTSQPAEMRLDPGLETTCYRIVQEALTNVIRHARARWVSVDLHKREDCLHVLVCDNGAGFNVNRIRQSGGQSCLGLLGMEERATLAGGKLEIKSTPNHGTEVHAVFPLRASALADSLAL
jgi:signal transduction histidine kinase